ncbi:MAG: sensor histidine kinase [Oscillatoriales cyanobacterium]|nr:MAG: sensor histidine kinase [Oscillatoriales cyanobacterium]
MLLQYRLRADTRRPEIVIQKHYGDLPEVSCFPGQLNQVFMNLLANAIDAFDEVARQQSFAELVALAPTIAIETTLAPDRQFVEIHIRDNAQGIPEPIRQHIFERSFTTKAVGRGTGLGLAIACQIVVDRHQGSLEVDSVPGQGSDFWMRLPLQARPIAGLGSDHNWLLRRAA